MMRDLRRLGAGVLLAFALVILLLPPAAAQEADSTATTSPPERSPTQPETLLPLVDPTDDGACDAVAAPSLPPVSEAVRQLGGSRVHAPAAQEKGSTRSAAVRVVARPDDASVVLGATVLDDGIQIVGTADRAGLFSVRFEHHPDCAGQPATAEATVHEDGSASVTLKRETAVVRTIGVAAPWAVDADGTALDTWYESDGSALVQVVDASEAVAPVTFDPTYTSLSCSGHYSTGSAGFYLNLWGVGFDPSYCPVDGMFIAANNYTPVWGHETNVANDYGKVIIRQDGQCSYGAATGWAWDFQVPCKAHDYCYDLRQASFSGTVGDSDCDAWFYWLMEAHCNDRILSGDCRIIRDVYYNAVSLPWVVTDPNPGILEIRNLATGKCADIEGPSIQNNVPVQQWSCVGVSNQRFRIYPAPQAAGYFWIRPTHSNRCVRVPFNGDPVQYLCENSSSMEFRIQGALNQDWYSIRSRAEISKCWKVPETTTNGADLVNPTCNDYSSWFIWRIEDV